MPTRGIRIAEGYLPIVKQAQKCRFNTQQALADAVNLSRATVQKFFYGQPIDRLNFIEISTALELDWQEIVVIEESPCIYWDGVPDVSVFYGRKNELATLKQWLLEEKCRLVTLLGLSGIGKTFLAAKLAHLLQNEFDYIIWQNLNHSPPLQQLLSELIYLFPGKKETHISVADGMCRLMKCLQSRRTLLILDGIETLLRTNRLAGREYREGYQDYGRLLKRVGESSHQSCLLLTSWEKPREVISLEGQTGHVRCLIVEGLDSEAAQEIFRQKGLIEEENEWKELIKRYGGYPEALKTIATTIIGLLGGRASELIKENTIFLGQIQEMFLQQFERLSELEIELISQIAEVTQPFSVDGLREKIYSAELQEKLLEILESLMWRSLILKYPYNGQLMFTLPPLLPEILKHQSPTSSRVPYHFLAMVPAMGLGFTAAEYPTFWLYTPARFSYPISLEFVLRDEKQSLVYQTTFELDREVEITSFCLPKTAPPLKIGKKYYWCFFWEQEPVANEGAIERIALLPELETQLKKATPKKRILLFAKNGLWYETLTELVEFRRRLLHQLENANLQKRTLIYAENELWYEALRELAGVPNKKLTSLLEDDWSALLQHPLIRLCEIVSKLLVEETGSEE
jgi:hypothetical protein